jgi:uncharacterized protein YbjT (DUF2867 family)
MKIKAIITGATGMVGEGVLHECLAHPAVEAVLLIVRRPGGRQHPKLREIVHSDFYDFSALETELKGWNACYFCLGVSSVGISAEEYQKVTYDLTLALARPMARLNPDMTFCYVSGAGTDSSEQGRVRWARVKGMTENHLLGLPFRQAFMFRPGYLNPTPGLRHAYRIYRFFSPFYPLWNRLLPGYVSTLRQLALAMINATLHGYEKPVLEVRDIRALGGRV